MHRKPWRFSKKLATRTRFSSPILRRSSRRVSSPLGPDRLADLWRPCPLFRYITHKYTCPVPAKSCLLRQPNFGWEVVGFAPPSVRMLPCIAAAWLLQILTRKSTGIPDTAVAYREGQERGSKRARRSRSRRGGA